MSELSWGSREVITSAVLLCSSAAVQLCSCAAVQLCYAHHTHYGSKDAIMVMHHDMTPQKVSKVSRASSKRQTAGRSKAVPPARTRFVATVGIPPGWPQMAVKKKAGSPNSLVACLGEEVPPGRTGTDWDEMGWVGQSCRLFAVLRVFG
jgi:hypothetical protein